MQWGGIMQQQLAGCAPSAVGGRKTKGKQPRISRRRTGDAACMTADAIALLSI
jgi:hypothetical protein